MAPLPSPHQRLRTQGASRAPRPHVAVTWAVAAALALASCSSTVDDSQPSASAPTSASPTATAPAPSASAPPSAAPAPAPAPEAFDASLRAEVALTALPGVDMGAAAGHALVIPSGWTAEVWANVPGARIGAWASDGRLVVSSASQGALVVITAQGEGAAPAVATLASGLNKPQGLGFAHYRGKDVLVVGEADAITVWDYADGTVSNRRVLVGGLPANGHGAKGIAVDGQIVYYSLGSTGNRSASDRWATPWRAVINQVKLNGGEHATVATGVRNGFGLGIGPDGSLFTAVNQSDNQTYPYADGTGWYGRVIRDFVNENPKDQVTKVTAGIDLGWPYCFPDAATSVTGVHLRYIADPETNRDGTQLDCSTLVPTGLGLPAHSAPLDIEFTQNTPLEDVLGIGALIGVHGSWNRTPPREPAVLWAPWDDARAGLGAAVPLVTGFQNADGTRWGRAVSAVPGPDGSLYVTDDAAGLVYRLTPPQTDTRD